MKQNINSRVPVKGKVLLVGGMRLLFIFCIIAIHSGCIPKANILTVDHCNIETDLQSRSISVGVNENQLLSDLYMLMKSNEKAIVTICEASNKSRRCIKNGVSVFVQGGIIPGIGKRDYYTFSNISLDKKSLKFTKDNSSTTFIGTPMHTRANDCRISIKNGGLQVEMTKYYANWAGIGNMIMAEGWAIDYINFDKGIVGLQLELDISGFLILGGGSKYVLLKFPRIPDALSQSYAQYKFIETKQLSDK